MIEDMRKGKLALDRKRVFPNHKKNPGKRELEMLAVRISRWADDLTATEKKEDGVFADA